MKKFFKGLALVLALTLIIGTVPVAAADSYEVKKATKTLYVDGAQGKSADGKLASKISNKVAIYKLVKGLTKADLEKCTAKIVKGDSIVVGKHGYIKAVALGKTTVEVLVDGKSAGKVTINAKKNATADTLVITGIEENVTVGKEITVSLPRAGKDSDERRLFLDGAAVAEAKAARTYTLKFDKSQVGEHTLKAEAFQSAKLDAATKTAEFKFNVVEPTPAEIKQTAYNAFQVIFSEDIEVLGFYDDVKAWDQNGIANRVYYKVNGKEVPFSSVKVSKPVKEVLNVTMYGDFVAGEKYFVDIAGKTFDFEAVGNTAKYVTDIKFTSNVATVKTNAPIKYQLLNAAGIDITKTAEADVNQNLMFSTTTTKAFVSGKTIWFNEVGDTADVTATFTFYDPDDNFTAKPVKATATITAIPEDQAIYQGASYTIDNNANAINYGDAGNHQFKIGDSTALPYGTGNTLQVIIKWMTGTKDSYTRLGGILPNGKVLQAYIADNHFAMISGNLITGVNAGSTSIVLYYVNDSNQKVVIDTLPIEIQAKRKASAIASVTANSEKAGTPFVNTYAGLLNDTNDTALIKVKVVDQYGDVFANDSISEVKYRKNCADNYATFTGAYTALAYNFAYDGTYGARIQGTAFTMKTGVAFGSAVFDIKMSSGLSAVASFNISAVAPNGANMRAQATTNGNSINTALFAPWRTYGESGDVKTGINFYDGSYYVGRANNITFFDKDIVTNEGAFYYGVGDTTGSAIYFAKVLFNGNLNSVTASGAQLNDNQKGLVSDAYGKQFISKNVTLTADYSTADTILFDAFDATGVKNPLIPQGSYTVQYYKVTPLTQTIVSNATISGPAASVGYDPTNTAWTVLDAGTSKVEFIGSVAVNVNNTQKLPTYKQDKQTTVATTALAAVKDAYTFYDLQNEELDDSAIVDVNAVTVNGDFYIYGVYVSVTLKNNDDADQALKIYVPVGELLNGSRTY